MRRTKSREAEPIWRLAQVGHRVCAILKDTESNYGALKHRVPTVFRPRLGDHQNVEPGIMTVS